MAWLRFEEEMHISIHALRKESDVSLYGFSLVYCDFNPRSP